ncbi:DinB family protein [Marinomonas sp. 2405UD68-3]|uniref:DinB family protein n=1 Tax=Marinomonas sp. 2405UD68-3 TaxID=3391835 RepID=UPI0039C9D4E7
MSLKSNFELMAAYNHGMNQSMYGAASQLSVLGLNEDRGAFFGSILATLNHILVGDVIWLKRFANHPSQFSSLDYVRGLEWPKALDSILCMKLEDLLAAREKMDNLILDFSRELTDDVLASSLSYQNMKGKPLTQNLGYLIQHFFNHQTHHRGQVSVLLNQAGVNVDMTDLLLNIPSEQKSDNSL